MSATAQFLALSSVLTGEEELDAAVGESFRVRLDSSYQQDLAALLQAFDGIADSQDVAGELQTLLDEKLGMARVAKELITVWYTSQFTRLDGTTDAPKSPDEYQAGVLWKVIRAHPPAVSSGPYGYWAEHPDYAASED